MAGEKNIIKSYLFNTQLSDVTQDPFYASHPVWTIPFGQLNISAFQVAQWIGLNTVYVIDARNNNFYFQEINGSGPILDAIVVPGNYTIYNFAAALQTAMNSAVGVTGVYTITIPTTSPTFGTAVIINSTVAFVALAEGNANMSYETGFTYPSTTFATLQQSNSPLDLSGLKAINIVSSNLGSNASYTPGSYFSVITTIPVQTPFGGVIDYINSNNNFKASPVSSLQNFECILYDDRMRKLILDNDWSLVLNLLIA